MTSPLEGSPPPGLAEGHIQLPTDGAGKMLRAFPITTYEQQGDGTFASETTFQQVFVLVDASGNLVGVPGGNDLQVQDSQTRTLLREIRDLMRELKEAVAR